MADNPTWIPIIFEQDGTEYVGSYEYSDGTVTARLYLGPSKGWSPAPCTHHVGPSPETTARMLLRELVGIHAKRSK